MTLVARLLQTLRQAAGLTRAQAAIAAACLPARICDLESGLEALEYLEAMRLTKTNGLCPPCFRHLFEAALDRQAVPGPVVQLARDATPPSERPTPIRSAQPSRMRGTVSTIRSAVE